MGQGQKPMPDVHDLQLLMQNCNKNRLDSVVGITEWALSQFQDPVSENTVHHCIQLKKKNMMQKVTT